MLPKNYDFLLVGQGLAGTLLGYFLEQAGARCFYLDAPEQTAASAVAAGIINPITGRRFVKSWRIDELLPFARQTYQALEKQLGITVFHEHRLIRTLFHRGDENDWLARTADLGYEAYMKSPLTTTKANAFTVPAFAYAEVAQAAQVAIGDLVLAWRNFVQQQGRWRGEVVDYVDFSITPQQLSYRDITARQVVFCEGWRARFNPFFQSLPHGGNKGEVLLVKLPAADLDFLFKHHLFIVPLTDGTYWIGSTSQNDFADDAPSTTGADYLRTHLSRILLTPYEVLAHRAAIRPTVRDRRPLLGRHLQHPALAIFNGLGTKGASLAPFWAQHLAQHLLNDQPLDPEVDIRRWNLDR